MFTKIFISYSSIDIEYKKSFKKHLKALQVEGIVEIWDGDLIKIGTDWDKNIKEHLKKTDILIILLSPDSVISEYINSVELEFAIQTNKKIFPILIRPCNWFGLSISRYQCLPKNGKPISSFQDKDQIYTEIVTEIRSEILLQNNQQKKQVSLHQRVDYKKIGNKLFLLKSILKDSIVLMEKIPLKTEKREKGLAIFLDIELFEEDIFELTLNYITIRNDLLDQVSKHSLNQYKEIENCLEVIYSFISMNRIGYNISMNLWKSFFKSEINNLFNQLFNKSLKIK